MVVYRFVLYDRHCECIYNRQWHRTEKVPTSTASAISTNDRFTSSTAASNATRLLRVDNRSLDQDDSKLLFGVIYSLRNLINKLSPNDSFISYQTSKYKLHYFETASGLKFVLFTDPQTEDKRIVLRQIYVSLYVEYVVKNPLGPAEHPNGEGVAVEFFELALDQFIQGLPDFAV